MGKSRAPQEDPVVVAERNRQMRLSEIERNRSAEQQAKGLTSDLRGLYSSMRMPNMFSGMAK